MEIGAIFGESFMSDLRDQAKQAYLLGVEDGKKLNKKRGFCDISKAQEETGYGRTAIENLRNSKKISFVKNGSKYLYDLDELYHYMQRQKEFTK